MADRQSSIPDARPSPCYACLYRPPGPDDHRGAREARRESFLEDSAISRLRSAVFPTSSGAVNVVNPLVAIAQEFSPRFERHHDELVSIDVSGLERLLGTARTIGEELRREASARGARVHVAVAATRMAALVLAQARPGLTVVDPGEEAAALAPVPIGILEKINDDGTQPPSRRRRFGEPRRSSGTTTSSAGGRPDAISALKRWGIKTLGELAALPPAELSARLGQEGLLWQAIAHGEDVRPLVPDVPEERFESSIELDWPIEGLEPLSFVLTRLLEPLSMRLERRDRGAAILHVVLRLVTCASTLGKSEGPQPSRPSMPPGAAGAREGELVKPRESHARHLELPSPVRDVRTLRTLALLDLESHPPPAAIDRVTVVIDPTPGRVLQHRLFTRAHPTPEQLSTLLARLGALMGQDRIGAPARVDSYRPGAFEMTPFATDHDDHRAGARGEQRRAAGGRKDRGEPHDTTVERRDCIPRPFDQLRVAPSGVEGRQARDVLSVPKGRDRREFHEDSASSGTSAVNVVSGVNVVSALRRCRQPVPARVAVEAGRPVRVTTDRRSVPGGAVLQSAGPWRTSGHWWTGKAGGAGKAGRAGGAQVQTINAESAENAFGREKGSSAISARSAFNRGGDLQTSDLRLETSRAAGRPLPPFPPSWDRDEWDVALSDGAVYRIFRDRETGSWFIDAIVD
jgi:hypothetical protein